MRDDRWRRAIKWVVRTVWRLEHTTRRRLGPSPRWRLEGTCVPCGACCERPTITVGRILWLWPTPRALFLAYQRHINGFELVERHRALRAFVFRCTHLDPQTQMCDSYDSRPWMCRDYPTVLLGQAWPELLPPCSHRIVDRDGDGLAAALDTADLDEETRATLKRRLRLPDA